MDDRTSGDQFTGGGANVRPLPTGVPQAITKQGQLYANVPCPTGVGLETPILTSTCTITPRYIPVTATPGGVNPDGTPATQIQGPPDAFGYYFFNNRRGQTTQEFRVSTIDPSWRLQFVFGGYIEHEHNHVNVGSSWNEPQITYQTLGIPEQWLQGIPAAPVLQTPGNIPNDVSTRNIDITEDEQSIFGEGHLRGHQQAEDHRRRARGELHPAVLSAVRLAPWLRPRPASTAASTASARR